MEQRSLPPLGSRLAKYTVPAALMQAPGQYNLAVRLRSLAGADLLHAVLPLDARNAEADGRADGGYSYLRR